MSKEFIEQVVKKYPVVIFSKTYCPFCMKAKGILKTVFPKVKTIELDKLENGSRIQKYLGDLTGASTVPRVFINQKFVGGCDTVTKLYKSGELQNMI